MKIIGTKMHAVMDYLIGVLLIASPWLFDFYRGGTESWMVIILGAGLLLYSLMTNYELSIGKVISMRTHLIMDFGSGVLLAVSPWLFGFAEHVYLPHLIIGVVEIMSVIFTKVDQDSPKMEEPKVQV